MNIVLISEAGGGKDLISTILSRHYGYNRYAFADNVKKVAEKWYPDLYGNGQAKPRWLLQKIGTMFREVDSDVWIKAMFKEIDCNKDEARRYGYSDESIVVTDCRMPNEYEALKSRDFIFIRINVDEEVRNERMKERGDSFTENDMKHHTETFYDSFECDYEVSNNGTLEELEEEVHRVMKMIMERG